MQEKVIFITGATGGIGKAAAFALARQGHRVIIHGRDKGRTQRVQQEIMEATRNKHVDYIVGDLFLLAEARRVAHALIDRYERLDVLINNAGGIMSNICALTAEGHETTIALNLLTPFVLMQELLPLLRKSEDGRIVNVSSSSHRINAKPDFSDLELVNGYNPLRAYGNSKLFIMFVTEMLSEDLRGKGIENVTVNTMHPGAVATGFGVQSDLGPVLNALSKVARLFFRTPEKGAETLVYLAADAVVKGVRGKYFIDLKPAVVSRKYDSIENRKKVWDYCARVMASVEAVR
ncbi:SDR family NAD(P)-dependent oxidoreductase [Parachryseolinea silvisoli]|jgi:NAD(P)-dependent dehydrogenase (short-subunit alcohol dehydrogenase family)|uniref:SDR family NAD(P)-dependent oxidoreductase n=1 Tax=Parachryseolinea silvisoli TaxID=2873601 RepID=UPI002265B394|nr:SDR family NAD(P)-dependent oxidoreductase [Parachryseolinea silvisoli]MCD9019264.1 SDR family NAD(P)-dependent oxidoreductase [Parachryseolinea silvisoli]